MSFGKREHVDLSAHLIVSESARHTFRLCASGCHNYDIMLTEIEARRLSLDMWRSLLHDVPDDVPLVTVDPVTRQYTLNKVEGRCVFLDEDNLCIVHKSSGLEAKPIACQFFPLHAIASPGGIHVALNTGCRRLVDMSGDDAPLDEAEARRLLAGVEAVTTIGETVPLTADQ